MPDDAESLTELLGRFRAGDPVATERLVPLVYGELRRVARRQRIGRLGRGRDATLDTTAVVHEVFLKLNRGAQPEWRDRAHFYAVAARAMRQIVTDHARGRSAEKRGGAAADLPLDEALVGPSDRRQTAWILDLDRALDELGQRAPRLAQVVEYRFFGGMTSEEIGEVLGTSTRTVRRDWEKARALLHRQLDA
ncbi:MAG: ECF-type sigma factor [Acidobacteriota bacterium]